MEKNPNLDEDRFLVVDIETVANERSADYFASRKYEAASNLVDPKKIEANIAEKRAKDKAMAPLSWWVGQIVCISANNPITREKHSFAGKDERQVITGFYDFLLKKYPMTMLTGKQTKDFDFPYLVGRSLALDIGIPAHLRHPFEITDINQIFGFSSSSQQRTSLANYAFGIGIDGKSAHGSEMAGMYAKACETGSFQEIQDYCEQDTEIVAEMLRRYFKPYRSTKE